MVARARVALISTGGTIDALGSSRLDLAWYTETGRRLPAGELLGRVPEVEDLAVVEPVDPGFPRRPSHGLTTADWLALARTLAGLVQRPDVDGVVVTHGTNTLEETAYFLQLAVPTDKPVVVVGAMRPANALGSDGALNLVRAVQAAAAGQSRGRGVLVLLNDTIHSARDVTKTATLRVQAFASPDTGPLGYADADGAVVFHHRPEQAVAGVPLDLGSLEQLPRVDVLVSYVGADGALVDAAVAAGARGLVSAGTGAGHPTPAERDAYDRASAAGVVLCQASRVGSGRVPASPAMRQRGIVAAGNLQAWKAKVLLSLALTATTDPLEIQRLFDRL